MRFLGPLRLNPAWTNSALARQWNDIQRLVGRAMMPQVNVHTATRLQAQEYGSGVYGTVMPTNKRNVVVKVTSDPTEARFAYILSRWPKHKYPPGIVRYFRVYQLSGSHDTRPIFILWREEAHKVGDVLRSDTRAAEYLYDIRNYADPAFQLTYDESVRRSHVRAIAAAEKEYRGRTGYENFGTGPGLFGQLKLDYFTNQPTYAGWGIQAARAIANDMAHDDAAPLVGAAIRDLIDYGIVLADVHLGNIGYVRRGGKLKAVITDPGNVAFTTTKYDDSFPPTVGEALEGLHGRRRMQARGGRGFARYRRTANY